MGDYDESSEPYIQENIDHLIDSTDLLAEKLLGIITSEEDALKKGKDVLIEIKGQEYIDEHESDYFLHNGKNVKFIRDIIWIESQYVFYVLIDYLASDRLIVKNHEYI